ncbi:MAG: metal ABC transporter substrate-binding protein, partial [Clostridia bacterium]
MKKISILATATAMIMALTACTSSTATSSTTQKATSTSDKISIVASSFYEYDWTKEILGENAENFELSLLMDNGVDLHSYEPSVQDITLISSSDLFIYNGGESDTWVNDIITQAVNEDLKALCVTQTLGDAVLAEVTVEGMEAGSHDHDHDHDDEVSEEEHVHTEDCDHDHDEE